jgi:hypothetical protein
LRNIWSDDILVNNSMKSIIERSGENFDNIIEDMERGDEE